MKSLFTFLLIFFCLTVYCQRGNPHAPSKTETEKVYDDYYNKGLHLNGFLVTIKNDTIKGQFLIKDLESSCHRAYLYDQKTKETTKYKPKYIKYYKRGNEEFFTKTIERGSDVFSGGKPAFMKLLIFVDYTLYQFDFSQTAPAQANQPTGSFNLSPNSKYSNVVNGNTTHKSDFYLERKGKFTRVKHNGFKSQMSKLVSKNHELSARILNKEFRFKDVPNIISIYKRQSLITNE